MRRVLKLCLLFFLCSISLSNEINKETILKELNNFVDTRKQLLHTFYNIKENLDKNSQSMIKGLVEKSVQKSFQPEGSSTQPITETPKKSYIVTKMKFNA